MGRHLRQYLRARQQGGRAHGRMSLHAPAYMTCGDEGAHRRTKPFLLLAKQSAQGYE